MSDQNPALVGGDLKNLRIGNAFQVAVGCGSEVYGRFSKLYGLDDTLPDVSVGLEPDQGRDSPILAFAR